MATQTAAIYCRSSKDRHDVSIDVQRRELQALAKARSLTIAEEFSDVVESGKDTDRAGFQLLLRALRNPRRGWDTLLLLDTSRLARRRHIAIVFEEVECRRHGVRVVYKSVPDADPITEMLLKTMLQAMDEWHSLTSRDKGLAGMAQNVRAGYRAGGRAPTGYQLRKIETGAIRDGLPVMKSQLEPSEHAPAITAYLRARASGLPRARAIAAAPGLPKLSDSTLVHLEWNALTYAGHTVWGVHAERVAKGGGYVGGARRRPRKDWMIQRGTHQALISDDEAERIVVALEHYSANKPRRTKATWLLSGVLVTPAGKAWHSDGERYYRVEGKRANRDELEQAVLHQVLSDLQGPQFVRALAKAAKRTCTPEDPAAALRPKLAEVSDRISRMMDLAADMADASPALRKIEELERSRAALRTQIDALEHEYRAAIALAQLTEIDIRRRLVELLGGLESAEERETIKDQLLAMLDRVELDPVSMDCVLHYRIEVSGNKMASPRGFEPRSLP